MIYKLFQGEPAEAENDVNIKLNQILKVVEGLQSAIQQKLPTTNKSTIDELYVSNHY